MFRRLHTLALIAILLPFTLLSCTPSSGREPTAVQPADALSALASGFDQLPEKAISVSEDGTVYAQYASPTTTYPHRILGDDIEASQLVVWRDGATYARSLADEYVFEDIKPRLVDVDGDGDVEVVTIRTHVAKGAGIMIYKLNDGALTEYAWVEEIGTRFRWLNIAAIDDLDDDGAVELAWIETPHIGGTLKVATIQPGKVAAQVEAPGYSNHAIGERNLCLSVVAPGSGRPTLFVPTQDRRQIVGFQLVGGSLRKTDAINHEVDFTRPLASQRDFANVAQDGNDCGT